MLVQSHDTGGLVARQARSLVGDAWATEVVPRLPANLAEQARVPKAFQRVRGLATPHDLLRGVLASVFGPLSPHRRGAWAVLIGLADISEAAWHQRRRARGCLAAASGRRPHRRADAPRVRHGSPGRGTPGAVSV